MRVARKLVAYDVAVTLTRSFDASLGLDERCGIANNLGADYFCSLHTNSGGGTGFESFIHTSARSKTENIRDVLHDIVAGYYNIAGFQDRGKKRADFAVLRNTVMPAVLLENFFIDNPADAVKLKDITFFDGLAGVIAEGLVAALGIPLKYGQPQGERGKTPAKGTALLKPAQARSMLAAKNALAPDYVDIYMSMEEKYGIRWDVVFAQSCKETAYWRFGGDVKPGQNNFAGLATFGGDPGASFSSPADGVEAQFQHWHVYYYGGDLPAGTKNLDPRRDAVLKSGWAGKLQYVEDLGGRWAPSEDYGSSIVNNYLMPMLAIQVRDDAAYIRQAGTSGSSPATPRPVTSKWNPDVEIARLEADGLINSKYQPGDPVTWGELATVINRLRDK
jgi:N-acetylmuramoyl-L-alanine amidase